MDQWCESHDMRGGMKKELWYRDEELGHNDKEMEEGTALYKAGGV